MRPQLALCPRWALFASLLLCLFASSELSCQAQAVAGQDRAGLGVTAGVVNAKAFTDFREVLDGHMLPKVEAETFAHGDLLFPVNVVRRAGVVRPFTTAANGLKSRVEKMHFTSYKQEVDLYDYLADDRVAGLLILKDGKVVLEDYELGAAADTRWISFSMAKSVSSTLVGIALKQGLIQSIDDPVTRYVPELKGGAYDQVTVQNLLLMASGVRWDETYTDPKSDRRKLLEQQMSFKPGTVLRYMSSLPRAGAPGTIWNYSTGETYLVGALLEGATHKPLAQFLSETLWSRLGMEEDATWWIESPGGMGLAGGGMGATLRDYARFGQFVLDGGILDGERLVPDHWFEEAGVAHRIGAKTVDYGYLWWPIPAGDSIHGGAFQAIGIFGQHLYVNPSEHLVIVVLSARPKPDLAKHPISDIDFFGSVARALQQH
jgi:CubicO group peptidase (beta-lactamase class C family)